jgi:hypothetical protein
VSASAAAAAALLTCARTTVECRCWGCGADPRKTLAAGAGGCAGGTDKHRRARGYGRDARHLQLPPVPGGLHAGSNDLVSVSANCRESPHVGMRRLSNQLPGGVASFGPGQRRCALLWSWMRPHMHEQLRFAGLQAGRLPVMTHSLPSVHTPAESPGGAEGCLKSCAHDCMHHAGGQVRHQSSHRV